MTLASFGLAARYEIKGLRMPEAFQSRHTRVLPQHYAFKRSPPTAATVRTQWLVGPNHAVGAHWLVVSITACAFPMPSTPSERFGWLCRSRLYADQGSASDKKGHQCFHAN